MSIWQNNPYYNVYSNTNSALIKWQTVFPDFTFFKNIVFDQLKNRWQDIATKWYDENSIHYFTLETIWEYLNLYFWDWNWAYNSRKRAIMFFIQKFEQEYINLWYVVRAYLNLNENGDDWKNIIFRGSETSSNSLVTENQVPSSSTTSDDFNDDYVDNQNKTISNDMSFRTDYNTQIKKIITKGINIPFDKWVKKFEDLFIPLINFSY